MERLAIPLKALDAELPVPACAYAGDAAVDLRSTIDDTLQPFERKLVPCGIAVAIPAGYAGFVLPRSGLAAKHGISLVNAPGLIDSNYRGEIKAILVNLDPREPFEVKRGDRIAQLAIMRVAEAVFEPCGDLPATDRGAGGFGSWADILESIRHGDGAFGSDWDFGDLSGFGGGARQPRPRKGQDMNVTLNVTFDEAFKGAEKRVTVRVPGRGESETLTVKIPAGAVDGGRLRFKGKGGPGENGGAAGDLLITTKIDPHPYYTRKGADVLMDVPVSVAEAALGASVVVPAPDGTKVRVRVPKGTQDDTVLSVRGKGAPKVKGDGSGDLKITVKVVVPKEMNEGQKKAMEDYLAATTDDVRSW